MNIYLSITAILLTLFMNAQDKFYPRLAEYCAEAATHMNEIGDDRKALLDDLAHYILDSKKVAGQVQLTFICTHNSRRSHMAQLWATAAAAYYGIDNVNTYSGGTEVTAFNPSAIDALERAGFKISKIQAGENPLYEVKMSGASSAMRMWSKKYSDPMNPQADFAAIMVCSDADQNCPFVPGAATRIAIPFDDPKAFDGTPSAPAIYDERSRQIATEMLYVMLKVKSAQTK